MILLRLKLRDDAARIFPGFKFIVFWFVVSFISLLCRAFYETDLLQRRRECVYDLITLLSVPTSCG